MLNHILYVCFTFETSKTHWPSMTNILSPFLQISVWKKFNNPKMTKWQKVRRQLYLRDQDNLVSLKREPFKFWEKDKDNLISLKREPFKSWEKIQSKILAFLYSDILLLNCTFNLNFKQIDICCKRKVLLIDCCQTNSAKC